MSINLKEQVKYKKALLENQEFDFDDVLEIKKITKKSYATGDEEVSFELVLTYGGPNIYAEISEDKAVVYGYWGSEEAREVIENENLYSYLLEMCL
jgi:hypothetical protein